jgi:hypothetical protein
VDNWRGGETRQLTYTLGWQGGRTQEGFMASSSKLPSRFPVGTKFVIEGKGQVYSRHLEFPDGTFFQLPATAGLKPKAPISRRQSVRRSRNRKG